MFGSSAKDRAAAFQNKAESNSVKKTVQGPRKIGKLNIPGQKPAEKEPAKPAPKNKVVKKTQPKAEMNGSAVKEEKTQPKEQPKEETKPKAEPKSEPKEQKPVEVAPTIKDSDLDLTVELEANIDLSSPAKEEVKVVPAKTEPQKTTEAEKPVKPEPEKVPDLAPTPSKPVEAKTAVVAGIPPPGATPADVPLKPEPAKPVEAKTTTVAGIAPAGAKEVGVKTTTVAGIAPAGAKEVEVKTTTVAGIAPAGAPQPKEQLAPKAAAPVDAKTTTVAGIPPPGEVAPQPKAVQPKSIKTVEGETMVVAGIFPGAQPPKEQAPAKTQPAPQPKAQAAPKETAPKAIGPVEAKTTVVAGIAPQGASKPAQQNPAGAKPATPEQPKEVRKRPLQPATKKQFKPIPEEFFDNLFYFSGMGTVVGSAMSKGVYVPKRNTSTALDIEVIEKYEAQKDEEIAKGVRVVKRARNEAEDLAEELRKLQALLSGLPTFGGDASQGQVPRPHMPMSQPRRTDIPGLDLISKKIEAVAKDIPPPPPPAPKMPPPPAPKMPPSAPAPRMPPLPPQPIVSAFTPVAHAPPPRAAVEHRVPPITGPGSNVGVFKGMTNGPGAKSHQSWQERYAGKSVTDAQAPKPFGGGDIPSGLKPWELSRLRGLEARGFEFTHELPQSGADHSDDFYHGGSQMAGSQPDDDIASYAPFLVSDRSKKRDRADMLHHEAVSSGSFRPPHMLASPVPAAALPYSDL